MPATFLSVLLFTSAFGSFFESDFLGKPFSCPNLSLPNHPWPFSSKPKTQKKKKNLISLSLSLSVCVCVSFLLFWSMILSFLIYDSMLLFDLWFFLSLSVCVYLLPFFFSDLWFFLIYDSFFLSQCVYLLPFFFSDLWFFLSLSFFGQNNERGCDDGFVDVKSVEISGIAEKGPFFGLKPSKSGFYFFIFPVWLLRKWGRKVLGLEEKPSAVQGKGGRRKKNSFNAVCLKC